MTFEEAKVILDVLVENEKLWKRMPVQLINAIGIAINGELERLHSIRNMQVNEFFYRASRVSKMLKILVKISKKATR
jgi:hypothetical protein